MLLLDIAEMAEEGKVIEVAEVIKEENSTLTVPVTDLEILKQHLLKFSHP